MFTKAAGIRRTVLGADHPLERECCLLVLNLVSHFALCPPYLPQTLPRLARAPAPLHP
jgi:hypothetical protein